MKYLIFSLKIILGLFLIYGGFNHFYNADFYNGFIPNFFPKLAINYIVGLIEILLGTGLFIKGYKKKSAYGIFLLMIVFMPIHIWDSLKEEPAIGSKIASYIRIAVQILLIIWAYVIFKTEKYK